ncbi:hypothetical protein [Mesorhizobium sophorae]|uniref:hypothetical protein n=1 Tax=Mesorhizobium sophorae TaxID=1300294 RepID=UPI0011815C06|nr:hypothetical protein [Mesorhizobium sophorae]
MSKPFLKIDAVDDAALQAVLFANNLASSDASMSRQTAFVLSHPSHCRLELSVENRKPLIYCLLGWRAHEMGSLFRFLPKDALGIDFH